MFQKWVNYIIVKSEKRKRDEYCFEKISYCSEKAKIVSFFNLWKNSLNQKKLDFQKIKNKFIKKQLLLYFNKIKILYIQKSIEKEKIQKFKKKSNLSIKRKIFTK